MNKWAFFLGGVVSGIVLTIIVLAIIANGQNGRSDSVVDEASYNNDITMFEEPGDIIEDSAFEVFQVIADDAALVRGNSDSSSDLFLGKVCLLVNKDGKFYYDQEVVKATDGKVFRQVGIYRYQSKSEDNRTVPIIMLMNK